MPKQEITIPIQDLDAATALAYAILSIQQLNWSIEYGGNTTISANTASGGKNKGQEVLCRVVGDQLQVSSEMVNNELADIVGKNKKNCARFAETFKNVSGNTSEEQLAAAKTSLDELKEASIKRLAEAKQEALEVDKAMNLSGSNLYVSYAIIAINILVFVLMCLDGAGIMEPNGYVHLKWGSNFAPLTLSGDWWRLISNMFIHFGVIHLVMNMYSLYCVSIYLEPMLGKWRFIAAYLCTGVIASLVSLWWHTQPTNSAGASGAVFGVYGVFFALLTSNLIPGKIRKTLLQSIAIFIGYNLLYGLKGGIDNAAHIGGLVSGFVFGYGYVWSIRKERSGNKLQWMVPAILVATGIMAFLYLEQNQQPTSKRAAILKEIKGGTYKDNDKFNTKLLAFDQLNAEMERAIGDSTLTNEQLASVIEKTALPKLDSAKQIISSTTTYDIAASSHQKAALLVEYIELRKEELTIIKEICLGADMNSLKPALDSVRQKAENTFETLLKL